MAEPQKLPSKSPADRPRVLSLESGEGGISLPGFWETKSRIDLKMPWVKSMGLEMELDRSLGGVVLRYDGKDEGKAKSFTVLIPLAHLRRVELESAG